MKLKPVIFSLVFLLISYSAYWYYIAENAEQYVEDVIQDLENEGVAISYDDFSVTGFPYRLIISLNSPKIEQVTGNLTSVWVSDQLLVYAQPWNFSHLIFTANASRLTVDTGETMMALDSSSMRLSYNKPKNNSSRISLELSRVYTSDKVDNRPLFSAENFALHIRPAQLDSNLSENELLAPKLADIALGIEGFTLGENSAAKAIDEITIVSSLRGENIPSFSHGDLSLWRDGGGTLEISQLDIIVGSADLKADGSLTLDGELRPLGALSTRIEAAQTASEVVSRFISLNEEARSTLHNSLILLQTFSGGDGIPLSLTAQNGALWLGPLRITGLSPIIQ